MSDDAWPVLLSRAELVERILQLQAALRWLQYQCSRVEWPSYSEEPPEAVAKVLLEAGAALETEACDDR